MTGQKLSADVYDDNGATDDDYGPMEEPDDGRDEPSGDSDSDDD